MSKEFYNYLSKKLIDYFNEGNLEKGSRFYIELDDADKINNFYKSLRDVGKDIQQNFTYRHNGEKPFNTFYLKFEKADLVIATNINATNDYLVTLRNQVVNQENEWENKALLILCTDNIDSIKGGMSNLQKEGMPLYMGTIAENLEDDVESSELNNENKSIVSYYIRKKAEEYSEMISSKTTLEDYKDVLGVINEGSINEDNLKKLGFFPDKKLKNLSPSKMNKRIKKNYNIFNKVSNINQYENNEKELSKLFSETGVKELKKNWESVDFSNVEKYMEDLKKSNNQNFKYIENEDKITEDGLVYWEKPQKDTPAGKRKRQIIIFNEPGLDQININFKFNNRVYKDFIKKENMSASGHTLKGTLDIKDTSKTNFFKLNYKHDDKNKFNFEFNIVVVTCEEEFLSHIKTHYKIDVKNKKIIIVDDESFDIIFGDDDEYNDYIIDEQNDTVHVELGESVRILADNFDWSNSSLNFNIEYDDTLLPIQVKEDKQKPVPRKSSFLWKIKRENKENLIYNNNQISQGVNSFYIEDNFKEFLNYEYQIIENNIIHGEIGIDGNINKKEINLPQNVVDSYMDIINYYKKLDNIPSLTYLDNSLKKLYINFLNKYNSEIENIKEEETIHNSQKLNLNYMGTYLKNNKVYFSSLSPINMAYQLEVYNQCFDEDIEINILEKLNANNLIPFYSFNDKILKPTDQSIAKEWLIFENKDVGFTSSYISKVVDEKMNDFVSSFEYLFSNDKSPIKINIINVGDDKEVVKGVFNFIRNRLPDKSDNLVSVELNIYNDVDNTYFDDLFLCDTVEDLKDTFGINIKSSLYDSIDILDLVQKNITYYKNDLNHDKEYAHISFYKLDNFTNMSSKNMDKIESNTQLNGLISDISYFKEKDNYHSAFGTKNMDKTNVNLLRTAINFNEFNYNSQNNGFNPYSKGKTIVSIFSDEKEEIKKLYNNSHWITFIDPPFGLEYFDDENELIIIHFSDQYTSSSKYDTITVTNKNNQYKNIIRRFLVSNEESISDDDLETLIKMFNSINGEWLLNIISNYSLYEDKIAVISAIKYILSILDNSNIIWIPISLDNLIRLSETVNIKKSNKIFSSSLNMGQYVEDLLLIGFSRSDDKIKVFYHPFEVKMGDKSDRNIKQLIKNNETIKKYLCDDEDHTFQNKFLRNFFIQNALSNEVKLSFNKVWEDKHMDAISNFKSDLVNDNYEISFDIEKYIGKGTLILYDKDETASFSINMENDVRIINLTTKEEVEGILKPLNQLYLDLQERLSDEDLLSKHHI